MWSSKQYEVHLETNWWIECFTKTPFGEFDISHCWFFVPGPIQTDVRKHVLSEYDSTPLNWTPLCYIATKVGIRLLVFGQRHMVFGRRLVVCGHHLIRPDCGFQLIHFHPLSPYQEFRKDFPPKLGEKWKDCNGHLEACSTFGKEMSFGAEERGGEEVVGRVITSSYTPSAIDIIIAWILIKSQLDELYCDPRKIRRESERKQNLLKQLATMKFF